MGKKKKNNNRGAEVNAVALEQAKKAKQALEEERQAFLAEKESFLAELAKREEEMALSLEKVAEVEQDVTAYLAKLRQEKEEAIAQEMETLYGQEAKRIEAEQEQLRQALVEDWNQRGEEIDRQVSLRLQQADARMEEREVEFAQRQAKWRETLAQAQEKELQLQNKEHALELSFQERGEQQRREWEKKDQALHQRREDILLEQGQLQGKIHRLQGELSRQQSRWDQEREEMLGKQGEQAEKYASLWSKWKADQEKMREYSQVLGGDLESHLGKMEQLSQENRGLREELSCSVPRTVAEDLEQLRKDYTRLQEERSHWEGSVIKSQNLEQAQQESAHALTLCQGELRFAEKEKEQLRVANENLEGKLEEMTLRYCTPSILNADLEQRVKQMTEGYELNTPTESYGEKLDELQWLGGIVARCSQMQMEFPLRILLAFHTAMKISDWSIITVLAGVSGTGKSKLPELYADFGGLNFVSVPVQEHWDSPESMLGYFNTMDNRFEPEPLLQFLLSVVEVPAEYRGLISQGAGLELEEQRRLFQEDGERTVSLVLLDEMNLAHVEKYFAEFLSKLEGRRSKRDVPSIEVKLGTGVRPYPLKLRRNVLWVGTMNQDETTKSLSDKVLDRGVVIHFPRPTVFLRRDAQHVQGKGEQRLPYKVWRNWQTRQANYGVLVEGMGEVVNEEAKWEMIGASPEESTGNWTNYKALVEKINGLMAREGRFLGHRVWQAMEFYVVNHVLVKLEMKASYDPEKEACTLTPLLKSALYLAMEDQIVQKIMPKLRGLEYYPGGMLDELGALLGTYFPHLREDYEKACTQGQGQFIWSSSSFALGTESYDPLAPWADLLSGWGKEESQL